MPESFINCGWASWTILLFSFLSFGMSFLSLVLSIAKLPKVAAGLGLLSMALSLLAMANGPIGMMSGRSKVDAAVSGGSIDPVTKAKILEEGYNESRSCLTVGVTLGTPSFVVSACALGLGLVMLSKSKKASAAG